MKWLSVTLGLPVFIPTDLMIAIFMLAIMVAVTAAVVNSYDPKTAIPKKRAAVRGAEARKSNRTTKSARRSSAPVVQRSEPQHWFPEPGELIYF